MKIGFGIRFKEAVAVSLVALTLVAVTTAVHLAQLTRVVVEEAGRQAQLVARQIFAQSSRSILRGSLRDPQELLRRDGELRGFLDASVGYSPHLLYVMIADGSGLTELTTWSTLMPLWPNAQESNVCGESTPLPGGASVSR